MIKPKPWCEWGHPTLSGVADSTVDNTNLILPSLDASVRWEEVRNIRNWFSQ